jgi:hypothetical protein
MKYSTMLIGLICIVTANVFSSEIIELDMELHCISNDTADELDSIIYENINYYAQAKNPENKQIFENTIANAQIAKQVGIEYRVPFKLFAEVDGEKLVKYRIEGIIPAVQLASSEIFNTPKISYGKYTTLIHDGVDLYVSTYRLDNPDKKVDLVFRKRDLLIPLFGRVWNNYLKYNFDYFSYKEMSTTSGSGNVLSYNISDSAIFKLDTNKMSAVVEVNGVEKTIWNHLDKMESVFVPVIILNVKDSIQIFTVLSETKDISKTDIFSVPSNAYEEKVSDNYGK